MIRRESTETLIEMIFAMCKIKEIIHAEFIADDLTGDVFLVDAEKIKIQFEQLNHHLAEFIDIQFRGSTKSTLNRISVLASVLNKDIKPINEYKFYGTNDDFRFNPAKKAV